MIVIEMPRGRIFACLLSILLTACMTGAPAVEQVTRTKAWSDEAQHRRDLMVGKWLGESGTGTDNLRLSMIERNDNGTYRITFRSYEDGGYEETVEVGLWGVSGSTYFTIMRGWIIDGTFTPSDPTRAYFYDSYRIVDLDAVSFEYESRESGKRFSNRRVGNDFKFSN